MIKFTAMASEHTELPKNLIESSERNTEYGPFVTYAWFNVENDSNNEQLQDIAIAVMDYKPSYSRRTMFVFTEPIWHFIQDERTPQQQEFINKNIDKLNDLFIDFAHTEGFLETVK